MRTTAPASSTTVGGDELGRSIYYYTTTASAFSPEGRTSAAPRDEQPATNINPEYQIKPGNFDTIWSAAGPTTAPQGHTNFSFHGQDGNVDKAIADKASFGRTWMGDGASAVPQGHSGYSFYFGGGSAPSKPAASTVVAEAPESKAGVTKKAKKDAKASASTTTEAAPKKDAAPGPLGVDGVDADIVAALQKLDFRVGLIEKVEKVKDSDALYKLQVNMGKGETKQVCSGIQKFYKEAEL